MFFSMFRNNISHPIFIEQLLIPIFLGSQFLNLQKQLFQEIKVLYIKKTQLQQLSEIKNIKSAQLRNIKTVQMDKSQPLSQEDQQNIQTGSKLLIDQNDIELSRFISPPNPITTKIIDQAAQNVSHIFKNNKNQMFISKRLGIRQTIINEDQQLSLQNFYSPDLLIFQKYQNSKRNKRNGTKYAASIFMGSGLPNFHIGNKYIGMVSNDNCFTFDSKYQSANLFQVYKTGDNQFDILLQNDLNTTGYAQWFNFKIKNKLKNTIIKLNIVNLVNYLLDSQYKSSSLYQKGMKPLTLSKQQSSKGWQRNTFQISYYQNQIPLEISPEKNYHTLSFCYQFKHENDQVQFSHFYPYTTMDLQNFLSNINGSKKV